MAQRIDPPANPAKLSRGKPYDWQEFIDWQDSVLDYGLMDEPANEEPREPETEQQIPGGFVGHWRYLGSTASRSSVSLVGYQEDGGERLRLDAGFLTAPPNRLKANDIQ